MLVSRDQGTIQVLAFRDCGTVEALALGTEVLSRYLHLGTEVLTRYLPVRTEGTSTNIHEHPYHGSRCLGQDLNMGHTTHN
jgi:hypothetical protein